jgi:hypothetical protein
MTAIATASKNELPRSARASPSAIFARHFGNNMKHHLAPPVTVTATKFEVHLKSKRGLDQ